MVNSVTNPAATIAMTIASTVRSARTDGRRRRRSSARPARPDRAPPRAPRPLVASVARRSWSVIGRTGYSTDYQNAAGLDRRAHGDRNVLDAARFRRSQLVLHLHSFDDDDRLAGGDLVARRHENPNDAPRHRRDDRLRALTSRGPHRRVLAARVVRRRWPLRSGRRATPGCHRQRPAGTTCASRLDRRRRHRRSGTAPNLPMRTASTRVECPSTVTRKRVAARGLDRDAAAAAADLDVEGHIARSRRPRRAASRGPTPAPLRRGAPVAR